VKVWLFLGKFGEEVTPLAPEAHRGRRRARL
jgi:hypothetical protein